jgi:hypothetical protein
LQRLLTCMLLFHYHGLWCPVCCYAGFCQLSLVDFITQLP